MFVPPLDPSASRPGALMWKKRHFDAGFPPTRSNKDSQFHLSILVHLAQSSQMHGLSH